MSAQLLTPLRIERIALEHAMRDTPYVSGRGPDGYPQRTDVPTVLAGVAGCCRQLHGDPCRRGGRTVGGSEAGAPAAGRGRRVVAGRVDLRRGRVSNGRQRVLACQTLSQ